MSKNKITCPEVKIKELIKSWRSGDKRVEPYMTRIDIALDKNNIKGQARTEIYNRCYESVYKAIVEYSSSKEF